MKTITICGSMKLVDEMDRVAEELTTRGFKVHKPIASESKDYSSMSKAEQAPHKNRMIVEHLNKIREADAILVVNGTLKNIEGYIGANSFLEMGFAFCLGKKIFLLHPIPGQPNSVEIAGMLPTVIHEDLSLIQ
jgi:nucleoside 2-deoxyribosyltransferase